VAAISKAPVSYQVDEKRRSLVCGDVRKKRKKGRKKKKKEGGSEAFTAQKSFLQRLIIYLDISQLAKGKGEDKKKEQKERNLAGGKNLR